jgi:hypothetical protein
VQAPRGFESYSLRSKSFARWTSARRRVVQESLLLPISKDVFMGPIYIVGLADVYVVNGNYDKSLDLLDSLLSMPAWISVQSIELEPKYDPLRKLPRYKALIAKYSTR